MSRYFSYVDLRSLLLLIVIAALALSCRPAGEDSPECQSDLDCSGSTPVCLEERCVECVVATDCECYEICSDENMCSPLGATTDNEAPNAHGNWSTAPSSPDYSFLDYCTEDSQCSLGELCNAATGGCVLAADYPESCASDDDCPRGPLGETLSCDLERSLCLPAAKCVDDQQCCGRSNVVCSQTQGLCLPIQDECTPTPSDELESTCPLAPRSTEGCADGLFCSNDGQCVQCQCDEDCGSPALKCRVYDGTCVSNSYCEQNADCGDNEVCKTDVNECVASCDPSIVDSCPPQSFCDPDTLYCRNNSERPCVEDSASPNHTLDDAMPLSLSFDSDYVNEFALCDTKSDYFELEFTDASELQIFISADERLEIIYNLLGADDQTIVASGFVGELGAELLRTTIPTATKRLLEVIPLNQTEGFYSLNISTSPARSCEALNESVSNDTSASATSLWNEVLDQGCTETTVEGQTSFNCPLNHFNLCPGDLDYYRWDVPANSVTRLAVSSSTESIEPRVQGPVVDLVNSAPTLTPLQDELGLSVYEFRDRNPATYFVVISDPTSREGLYTLSGEVYSSECTEDSFDQASAATSNLEYAIEDADGLNDETPTQIFMTEGETQLPINICVNDIDRFSLRSQETTDYFPRGQTLRLTWSEPAKPILYINGEVRSFPFEFVTSENEPLEIRLENPQTTTNYIGNLILNWDAPQACTTPSHVSPAGAVVPEDSETNTTGTINEPGTWCGFEDRWYLFTVPANSNLQLEAASQIGNLELEFHDDSLRSLDEPTFDLPLNLSRLLRSPSTLATPQLGFLSSATSSRIVYARVRNLSGQTDTALTLHWRTFEDICTPDESEDDDRIAQATMVSWSEGGFATSGVRSACPGDDDWFELTLGDSSLLQAQLLTPLATSLSFELYDSSLNRLNWSNVATEIGAESFQYTTDSNAGESLYARIRSLTPLSAYRVDFQADGVCIDDTLESPEPVELVPELSLNALKLCNDEDEFIFNGLPAGQWHVCVTFEHDLIDIDIQLTSLSSELIDASATKEDLESISFESIEGQSYILTVYADSRSSGIGTYNATLQTAPCTSQP